MTYKLIPDLRNVVFSLREHDHHHTANRVEQSIHAIADLNEKLSAASAEIERLKGGWISVADRLPEHQQTVSVAIGGVVGLASFNKTLGFPTLYFGSQESYGHIVTHWQPLPQPPKEPSE